MLVFGEFMVQGLMLSLSQESYRVLGLEGFRGLGFFGIRV